MNNFLPNSLPNLAIICQRSEMFCFVFFQTWLASFMTVKSFGLGASFAFCFRETELVMLAYSDRDLSVILCCLSWEHSTGREGGWWRVTLVKANLGCGQEGKTSWVCDLEITGRRKALFVEREVQERSLQPLVRHIRVSSVLTGNSRGEKTT